MNELQETNKKIEMLKEFKLGRITHDYLVDQAKNWLLTAKDCNPVFTELGSSVSTEIPDAIGWSAKGSILVECKISVSDFRANEKKAHGLGMGERRYFLMTNELYSKVKNEIPWKWGIVILNASGYAQQAKLMASGVFEVDIMAELYYLRNRILNIQRFGR